MTFECQDIIYSTEWFEHIPDEFGMLIWVLCIVLDYGPTSICHLPVTLDYKDVLYDIP